jgi:hypothetical protein
LLEAALLEALEPDKAEIGTHGTVSRRTVSS